MPNRRDTDPQISMSANKKAIEEYNNILSETRLSYSAFKTQLTIYFEKREIGSLTLDKIVAECKVLPAAKSIPADGFSAIMAKDKLITDAINVEIKRFIDRS